MKTYRRGELVPTHNEVVKCNGCGEKAVVHAEHVAGYSRDLCRSCFESIHFQKWGDMEMMSPFKSFEPILYSGNLR